MWGKRSDKLCFLCKARSEAVSAKKTWDMGHFEHLQHKGNSTAEQRALHNRRLLRLQHWSVPTQHHQLSNPTAFLRDELKNIKKQEPGPILPKFISSSIILQLHELHRFKRQQNSPSRSQFPRLQSQGIQLEKRNQTTGLGLIYKHYLKENKKTRGDQALSRSFLPGVSCPVLPGLPRITLSLTGALNNTLTVFFLQRSLFALAEISF